MSKKFHLHNLEAYLTKSEDVAKINSMLKYVIQYLKMKHSLKLIKKCWE